jgi:Flp pilus assembly protein TadG
MKSKSLWRKIFCVTRKSYREDDRGATAVEFAMVAPVFFLMVGITLETGLMLFTEYVLQTSVQEAARLVRTGQAQTQALSASLFKGKICDLAGVIINCTGNVSVYLRAEANFATLDAAVPSYLSVGTQSNGTPGPTSYNCGGPSQAIALIATYDWEFTIPYFMKYFGNMGDSKRRLAGFAMFKNEPFPSSTSACT